MIPGVGGTVASFAAYGHAKQSAKDSPEGFGQGDIRGVLAPEAANDAKDGGALLPTLALGIPGSAGTALLLAAMTIHGLVPGKELMTTHLHLVFVLIWSLFISNWLTSIFGLTATGALSHLTLIPTHRLVPIVIVMAAAGAYANQGRIGDVAAAFLFGILGYYMKKHGWARIPLVTALILGGLFETNLHITMRLHDLGRINFWTRPLVLLFLASTVLAVVLPIVRRRGGKQQRGES
jgi:TctA family transporter